LLPASKSGQQARPLTAQKPSYPWREASKIIPFLHFLLFFYCSNKGDNTISESGDARSAHTGKKYSFQYNGVGGCSLVSSRRHL
jgi:hypothetical protein